MGLRIWHTLAVAVLLVTGCGPGTSVAGIVGVTKPQTYACSFETASITSLDQGYLYLPSYDPLFGEVTHTKLRNSGFNKSDWVPGCRTVQSESQCALETAEKVSVKETSQTVVGYRNVEVTPGSCPASAGG